MPPRKRKQAPAEEKQAEMVDSHHPSSPSPLDALSSREEGRPKRQRKSTSQRGAAAAAAAAPASPILPPLDVSESLEDKSMMSDDTGVNLLQVLNSVIKIFCTYAEPNFSQPWVKKRQENSTSSGFIISGRRILCNAHGIAFAAGVTVRKHGDSKRYFAKVAHVGHECDLAMLIVDNEDFWKNVTCLELGDVPRLHDEVTVVGYPTGGDNISVTKGVVSRVGVGRYSHTGEIQDLLTVQIDAAINAGNSGGPSMKGNKVVGVAFETLDDAENIGYLIPVPVIKHFLMDIERFGSYKGFCTLGLSWQAMDNPTMRDAFGMPNDENDLGVLVNKLEPLSDTAKVLKPDDVLLAFDGNPIASDGTIVFRDGERVLFTYLVSSKYVGETATLSILRERKELKVQVTLDRPHYLVRPHMFDVAPSYFIYGGLVFTVVSQPFLASEYGCKWDKKAPIRLCEKALHGTKTTADQEVVVLNHVLMSDLNLGYDKFVNLEVTAVNGTPINNLRQLVTVLTQATTQFVRINLDKDSVLILERERAIQSQDVLLKQNNIPRSRSEDLEGVGLPL